MFDDLKNKSSAAALEGVLRTEIEKAGGSLSFDRYMELCLYHPDWGYYMNPHFALGKEGDFTTAAELCPVYAACMANAAKPILSSLTQPAVLEIGGGSGQFALDFLMAAQHSSLRYYIHEISPRLRQQQYEKIQKYAPHYLSHITWLTALPETFEGVIIANEVLDALPVRCFAFHENKLFEKRVIEKNNTFQFELYEPDDSLKKILTHYQDTQAFTSPYESEINLNITSFVTHLGTILNKGLILFADYGYGRNTLYHPARQRGTLTCFYQHQRHDYPFFAPGLQDITAHVDFTTVAEAGLSSGCELAGYTPQAAFLFESGLGEWLKTREISLSEKEKFTLHQAIKTLTLPTEMGEVIKIMGLAKAVNYQLPGMRLADRRHEL